MIFPPNRCGQLGTWFGTVDTASSDGLVGCGITLGDAISGLQTFATAEGNYWCNAGARLKVAVTSVSDEDAWVIMDMIYDGSQLLADQMYYSPLSNGWQYCEDTPDWDTWPFAAGDSVRAVVVETSYSRRIACALYLGEFDTDAEWTTPDTYGLAYDSDSGYFVFDADGSETQYIEAGDWAANLDVRFLQVWVYIPSGATEEQIADIEVSLETLDEDGYTKIYAFRCWSTMTAGSWNLLELAPAFSVGTDIVHRLGIYSPDAQAVQMSWIYAYGLKRVASTAGSSS